MTSPLSALAGVQALPFFALPHTSLDLRAAAALMHTIANCIVETNESDRIVLQAAEGAVKATLTATTRGGSRLVFDVAVAVAGKSHATLTGLEVNGNTYCAAAAVCGTIYRKAILLMPPHTPSNWRGTHLATPSWPPSRVVSLAVALYMETFNTEFESAEVTPRSIANSIVRFTPRDVYLHIEYKAREVSIVVKRSPQHKDCHAISLPDNLAYSDDGKSFCWKNTVRTDGSKSVPKHVHRLWTFFAGTV
jgi:hypothetical protein